MLLNFIVKYKSMQFKVGGREGYILNPQDKALKVLQKYLFFFERMLTEILRNQYQNQGFRRTSFWVLTVLITESLSSES